jgi:hypothetical protein
MQKISLETWLERARQCRPGAEKLLQPQRTGRRTRAAPLRSRHSWTGAVSTWRGAHRNGTALNGSATIQKILFIYFPPLMSGKQIESSFFLYA